MLRGLVDSSHNALYYNGQFVVIDAPVGAGRNFGPLPLVCNDVTMPTNADGPAEWLAFALHAAQFDPPNKLYYTYINRNLLVLTQDQMFDLFGL